MTVNCSVGGEVYDFLGRHAICLSDLSSVVGDFRDLNVCVIGDTIVDEYIQCDPLGMSQEDPTLVVTPVNREHFIGGAAIVASHIKGLGAKSAHFLSVLGQDHLSEFVQKRCVEYGVSPYFLYDSSRPTSLKQRFRSEDKTLLRVNTLSHHMISETLQHALLQQFRKIVGQIDLLIFSDFNYGVLPQPLVEGITQLCKSHGVMLVADSQCSSQIGDISRFTHMNLVTPTEYEVRQALNNSEDNITVLAELLREKTSVQHLFMTLGPEGVLLCSDAGAEGNAVMDRLPAFNSSPVDCAGAGDCFMATAAMAMVCGANDWLSGFLGSLAAACQVSKMGNIPLQAPDLNALIQELGL